VPLNTRVSLSLLLQPTLSSSPIAAAAAATLT
jgi:hypothetical protein